MRRPELKQIREELKLKKQYENVKSRYIDVGKLKMHRMSNKNLEIRRNTCKQKNFCMINRSRLKDPLNYDFQRSQISKSIDGSNSSGSPIHYANHDINIAIQNQDIFKDRVQVQNSGQIKNQTQHKFYPKLLDETNSQKRTKILGYIREKANTPKNLMSEELVQRGSSQYKQRAIDQGVQSAANVEASGSFLIPNSNKKNSRRYLKNVNYLNQFNGDCRPTILRDLVELEANKIRQRAHNATPAQKMRT